MDSALPDTYSFPKEEEKILELWEKLDAFKTSLKQSKDRPKYVASECMMSNGRLSPNHGEGGMIRMDECVVL